MTHGFARSRFSAVLAPLDQAPNMGNALCVHLTQSQVETKRLRNTQLFELIRMNGNQPKPTAQTYHACLQHNSEVCLKLTLLKLKRVDYRQLYALQQKMISDIEPVQIQCPPACGVLAWWGAYLRPTGCCPVLHQRVLLREDTVVAATASGVGAIIIVVLVVVISRERGE